MDSQEGPSSGPSDRLPTDTVTAIPEVPEGAMANLVAFIQRQVAEAVEKTTAPPPGLPGVTLSTSTSFPSTPPPHCRAIRHRLVRMVYVGLLARVIFNAPYNIHCRPYQKLLLFCVIYVTCRPPAGDAPPNYPPLVPSPR